MSSPGDLVVVPPEAAALGTAFAASGHELHLVGGTVRDALLGRPDDALYDLDFTTDARPEQILEIIGPLAQATWTTGIEFGTVGVQIDGRMCEITTFRADRYDRVSRNPQVAFGESLHDDLSRRDFTMNAMALSVTGDARFTDPFGGLADLARGVLRTPGRPEDSFADDPLRMLRAVRFVSTLAVTVDPEVIAAMRSMAGELARITAERVQAELSKLLLGDRPRAALELLVDSGLADVVLPELPALRMADDEHGQHKDVYLHTLQVLEQAIALEDDGPDLVLRWAALLHDIGKPQTRAFVPGGRVTFHHHEVVGARLARRRLKELRFGKQLVEDVGQLVFLHLRFYGYREGEWTDAAVRRYVVDAGPLLPRLHKLVRSDCTTRNARKASALSAAYDRLEQRIAELQKQEELAAIRPDLDGNEIMQLLDVPPGPLVGHAYRHLLALRMEHGPLGHDRAVQELRDWYAQQQSG
ncbi:MAG TPA: CCA tRNA nucleotidyltransferase [Jatrophihabitantaceae bacterium]|nr:CCA tRNA nucleotidyltransferase [Jatrophihabitantaceae bacterium]